jgi:hypothetical protein
MHILYKFIEVDCGPGGYVWELHSDKFEHIRTYASEESMLNDAALLKLCGVEYRFYTQAEYNLEMAVEIMIENGVWNGQA